MVSIIFTGNTAAGSSAVGTVSSQIGLDIGQFVTGPGVPAGTFITAVAWLGGSGIDLSANVTATASGVSFTAANPYFTAVTAARIWDASMHPLAAGRVTFFPVNNYGKPVSAIAGGAGLITQSGVVFLVVNGVITTDLFGRTPMIADTALTTPANICYRISVTDASGAEVQGPGYGLQQPSGDNFNLDTALPNQPMNATIQTGPQGPAGVSGGIMFAVDEVYAAAGSKTITHNLAIVGPVVQGTVTSGPVGGVPRWWSTPVDSNNTTITSMGPMTISLRFLGGTSGGGGITPAAPAILTNPVAWTGASGATISFSASASGVLTPTVQWQVSTDGGTTWANVSGATSTTYSVVAAGQNGYDYRAVFTNGLGTATTSAALTTITVSDVISASGLMRFWKMNEGAGEIFTDTSPSADTTAGTAVTWGTTGQDGFPAKPALFDGSTSVAVGGSSTGTNFDGSTPFSAAAWINPGSVTGDRVLLSTIDLATTAVNGWSFETTGNVLLAQLINTFGTNYIEVQAGSNSLSIGTLYHVGFSYDGSKTSAGLIFYLNGVALGSRFIHADTLTGSIASAVPVMIGARRNGAGSANFYDGAEGFARIYSRVVTPTEFATLNAAGPA